MPVHFAGLPVDMERLYAHCQAPQAARHRGCRARHRLGLARAAHRQLRRPGVLQLPPEQEHHHHRGRLRSSAARPRRWRRIELHRFHGQIKLAADDGSTSCSPAASSTCPTWRRAVGLGQLRRLERVQRAAPRSSRRAISSAVGPRRARCACPRAATRGTAGTCSRRSCRSSGCSMLAPAVHRAMEERGIGVGVHYAGAMHLFTAYRGARLP